MKSVGIFFGTDTGNTENIAKILQKKIGTNIADVFNIATSSKEDLEKYNKLILGIPTWYYGEPQCDWDDFFPILKNIDFNGKNVAIFGCGDQEDYSEYFCDAMGLLWNNIKHNNVSLVGRWKNKDYYFESSVGLLDKDYFVGLAIDEDRQHELTEYRINKWINQLSSEMRL